ncbi:hypothetical protein KSP39_PZI003699 [Platanthera zijinensis]|uniref:SAP domain-containing protein n=1 Tax=Platanthera zijinensis TaxID=2320716 RepID=A0AAP0GDH2_9ASPA
MPSQYSVLDNKPIDQWKVIELREELRRRNLVTKGLKEELVKRLDEAIKKELESENEKETGNGDGHISDPQNDTGEEYPSLEATDDTQATLEEDNTTDKDIAIVNISHGVRDVNQGHENQNGDVIKVVALAGKVRERTATQGDLVGCAPENQNFSGQSDTQGEDDDSEKFEESNSPLVGIDETASAGDLEDSALVNQNITVQSDTLCVEVFKTPIVETEEKEATTCDLESSALVNQNITAQSDKQGVDADLKEIFKSKTPIVGADERETTAGDFEGSALVNQNITVQSDTQCVDADLKEMFEESKTPIVGTNAMEATCVLEGSALVNQNITLQSDTQCIDANFKDMLEESKTPIVGTDEKEATACDLEASALVNQNITVQSDTQVVDAALKEIFEESKTPKGSAPFNQNTALSSTTDEDALPREKFEESKPVNMESTVIQSEQHNQVSEVNQDLGFQVKYKSNCTDSVSIIEKNNIKDNLTADNFPLELVVKQEVVQPSSSSFPVDDGHSYMVVDEQEAAKDHAIDEQVGFEHQVFVGEEVVQNLLSDKEETNIGYATNEHVESMVEDHPSLDDNDMQNTSSFDVPKKEDCVESGSPEKLNLDRSSGDESMEEDMLDSKHTEADIKSEDPTSKIDVITSEVKLEERVTDVGKSSSELKEIDVEEMKHASLTEKRKLEDAEVAVSNGAPKRHRRWNPDTIKVSEQQTPLLDTATASKNNLQPTLRRTFNRSNSTISVDSPKERIVPIPKKPATTSLRIDNFLRPFTLKAVQELLGKTGRVCDFWMDHIKTHCFVTYSSVEEATETRNAVYNLQWPPNGGRFLAADFVDPQDVKLRLAAAPPPSPAPISSGPATQQAPPSQRTHASQPTHQQNLRTQPQAPSQHALAAQPILQQNLRPQLPPPPPISSHLPPPPSLSLPNTADIARERLPPPPPQKKPEPPVMTLDDLFKKTRATPRIYYLPLTEEQARAKLAGQQSKRTQL